MDTNPSSRQPSLRGYHSLHPPRSSAPLLRRQGRLADSDPPNHSLLPQDVTSVDNCSSTSLGPVCCGANGEGGFCLATNTPSPSLRDHGLRTPPGPPTPLMPSSPSHSHYTLHRAYPPPGALLLRSRQDPLPLPAATESQQPTGAAIRTMASAAGSRGFSTIRHGSTNLEQQRMAHEMVEYLVPPTRPAHLVRAHTDPSSQTTINRLTPGSPPPAYEEVMKEVVMSLKVMDNFESVQ